MDETKRELDLRAVLGVFAVVLAAAALWAASAFAAGGSASNERGDGDNPGDRERAEPRRAGRRLPAGSRRLRGQLRRMNPSSLRGGGSASRPHELPPRVV